MNVRVLVLAMAGAMLAMALAVYVVLSLSDVDVTPEPSIERVDAPAAPPPAPEPVGEPVDAAPAPRAAAAPPAPPPAPTLGTLRIDADVPGAQVFLDRQFVGTAPLTLEDVQPGRRQLNVSAEGYEGVAETIEVEPGTRDIRISLREVRLDAAIEVVHRHRFGSCEGRLVADVHGLRYETSHDDAFRASLDDLETFEVDYLDNNLRIRLRGGRTYNFTDPDGNADHLFVFHRDVERARERLAAGDPPAR